MTCPKSHLINSRTRNRIHIFWFPVQCHFYKLKLTFSYQWRIKNWDDDMWALSTFHPTTLYFFFSAPIINFLFVLKEKNDLFFYSRFISPLAILIFPNLSCLGLRDHLSSSFSPHFYKLTSLLSLSL